MIQINHLKKTFGKNRKPVLNDINLTIKTGDFYGIFGKNGAGKSTLFKLILGLQQPTDGTILINERKVSFNKEIGYLPENIAVYPHLNVRDNLIVSALCADYKLSPNELKNILISINLLEHQKIKAKDLSLGMKRRLQFAMATMIKPTSILILDEPTNGLDINGVLWLRDYLKNLHKDNKTILICSHSLDTMEELITNYCIMKDGKIMTQGNWNQNNYSMYEVIFQDTITKQLQQKLKQLGEITHITSHKAIVRSENSIMTFIMQLHMMKFPVKDVNKYHEKLEDIFIESVNI